MGENSLWSTGFWSSFAGYSCIGFSALPPGASYKSKWAANWLMNFFFASRLMHTYFLKQCSFVMLFFRFLWIPGNRGYSTTEC
jgi:hypothetical protein